MKRTFSAMAFAVSMAVGATAAGAAQERVPELPRPSDTAVKSITLTGCLERGTEIESYTLTEAKEGATTTSNVTPRRPVAISSTDVDISKHVGHSVSVTGSYAKADIGKTLRTFTVTSLKILASSCQQSTH